MALSHGSLMEIMMNKDIQLFTKMIWMLLSGATSGRLRVKRNVSGRLDRRLNVWKN